MEDLQTLFTAIVTGDAQTARAAAQSAAAAGVSPQTALNEHMIPAMDEVGRLFEANEYFVPELLISARAMKAALEIFRPQLVAGGAQSAGAVVIGTVKGDLHDIGKNLVAAMLEGGGFEIIDLGVDVGPAKFLEAFDEHAPDIIALSALLTTTMPSIKLVIDAFEEAGLRDRVKIMVGGAPVTPDYARQMGADGYSETASGAVVLARELLGAR
jgi:5-methyltetrahydrofolate--homocysteine methyltransferase